MRPIKSIELKDIIFKKHEITHSDLKMCPSCLSFIGFSATSCDICKEDVSPFTENNFLTQRQKFLEDDGRDRIGISNLSDKDAKSAQIKKSFDEQFALWLAVLESATYLQKYCLFPLDVIDIARHFLKLFPLSQVEQDVLRLSKIEFPDSLGESAQIYNDLTLIDQKDYSKTLCDLANWSLSYTTEAEREISRVNSRWLNVAFGYYLTHNSQRIQIDERSLTEIQTSLDFLPNYTATSYNLEIVLSLIHWKALSLETLDKDKSLTISKPRYKALVQKWNPQTFAQQAWRDLALAYAADAKSPHLSIEKYRDVQLAQEFEDRDNNFLFSYMIIFEDRRPEILSFPKFYGSFYAPLLRFQTDPEVIEKYFFEYATREGFERAILYFDFNNDELTKRVVKKVVDDFDSNRVFDFAIDAKPNFKFELASQALLSGKIEILKKMHWNPKESVGVLKKMDLTLHLFNSKGFLQDLLKYSGVFELFSFEQIAPLLDLAQGDLVLFEFIVDSLRRRPLDREATFIFLFGIWARANVEAENGLGRICYDSFSSLIQGQFKTEVPGQTNEFVSLFKSLFLSKVATDRKKASLFIDRYDRAINLNLDFFNANEIDVIFDSLLFFIKDSTKSTTQRCAYSMIYSLLQRELMNDNDILLLKDNLPLIDGEYRDQLRVKIAETPLMKKHHQNEKNLTSAKKQDEKDFENQINLLKEQLLEAQKQLEISESTRLRDGARDQSIIAQLQKTIEYQAKMANIQNSFHAGMISTLTSPMEATERSQRISKISLEFQDQLKELQSWFAKS